MATVDWTAMTTELDPETLAAQRCVAVDASTPTVEPEEARRLATGLDEAWSLDADRLVRALRFSTFGAAFAVATRVALLAEAQGHHPTLEVGWGRLVIVWMTDAIDGLSGNDFIMAAKVDRMLARGLGPTP